MLADLETASWAVHVDVSPRKDFIAVSAYDELKVFSTEDWSVAFTLSGSFRDRVGAAFNRDGSLFACSSRSGAQCYIYDTDTWARVRTIDREAHAVAWSGSHFAISEEDGDTYLYDTDTWSETQIWIGNDYVGGWYVIPAVDNIVKISFSQNGRYLAAAYVWCSGPEDDCGYRGTKVLLWDVESGLPLLSDAMPGDMDAPYQYEFSPVANELAVAGQMYGCGEQWPGFAIVDIPSGEVIHSDNDGFVVGIGYSPGGQYVAIGQYKNCDAESAAVYHRDDWSKVSTFEPPPGQGSGISFA
jgi:WD40 repeat protein